MKVSGLKVDINTLLMARIADSTALNVYAKTKDAQSGRNRPKSMTEALLEINDNLKKPREFNNGDDFMAAWNRIVTHGKRN